MLTRKPSEDARPLLDLISIGQIKRVGAAAPGSVVAGEQSKTRANVSDVAAGGGDATGFDIEIDVEALA
jgi:hypothetical protein